jgi:hypothetical protein
MTLIVLLAATSPASTAEPKAADVKIEVTDGRVEFRCGKGLAVAYVTDAKAKPYFWPLTAPCGLRLTRDWPMAGKGDPDDRDHVHQKSAWFCHGDVIPEGVRVKALIPGVAGVDFWSETPGHGVIVCTKVGSPEMKGPSGRVATTNEWRTADGIKVLDEKRTLTFTDLGNARLLVMESDIEATVPVAFGDTKEGSFGVRMRRELTEQHGSGRLTNAEGKTGAKNVWGQSSAWCDYSGTVDGKAVGVAIFADPSNSVATCWHSRDYGLMAANPFGRSRSGFPAMKGRTDCVKLAKGEHLKLRYGLLLHDGDVKDGRTAEHYETFARRKGE